MAKSMGVNSAIKRRLRVRERLNRLRWHVSWWQTWSTGHMHAVKAVCILQRKLWIYNRKLQDYRRFLGTKVPGNESSKERNVPGNESSLVRKFQLPRGSRPQRWLILLHTENNHDKSHFYRWRKFVKTHNKPVASVWRSRWNTINKNFIFNTQNTLILLHCQRLLPVFDTNRCLCTALNSLQWND